MSAPLGSLPPEPTSKGRSSAWTWLAHLLLAATGFVLAAVVCPLSCHCPGQLTACKSNCKNVVTALEMYASDNQGQYPTELADLIPGNYLKCIPTCPAAGNVTFTDYCVGRNPPRFRFSCVGNNHAKAYTGFATHSDNFPQYDAEQGLIDHP